MLQHRVFRALLLGRLLLQLLWPLLGHATISFTFLGWYILSLCDTGSALGHTKVSPVKMRGLLVRLKHILVGACPGTSWLHAGCRWLGIEALASPSPNLLRGRRISPHRNNRSHT